MAFVMWMVNRYRKVTRLRPLGPPRVRYDVLKKLPPRPVIAHRGGSWMGPANTMYTYRKAVYDVGVHILEVDLHLCKDGHVVLMHDRYVQYICINCTCAHILFQLGLYKARPMALATYKT